MGGQQHEQYKDCFGMNSSLSDCRTCRCATLATRSTTARPCPFKLPAERPEGQEYEEAGDPQERSAISAGARAALARPQGDHRRHCQVHQPPPGRALDGRRHGRPVRVETWFKHTLATLRERGLIRGVPSRGGFAAYGDMEQCIQARVVEYASEKQDERYKEMGMFVATPGTYTAIAKKAAEEAEETDVMEPQMARQVDDYGFAGTRTWTGA